MARGAKQGPRKMPTTRAIQPTLGEAGTAVEEGFGGPQVCTIVGITYRQRGANRARPPVARGRGREWHAAAVLLS